ncbi:MAG: hypothetical protein B7Y40_06630 [Gammaproteobacteria bacterium 28-57-27]|nr:MAG: hypothetical protein B7Y40_06630 [Gammaproteobacteria bacterium 28-57-27]
MRRLPKSSETFDEGWGDALEPELKLETTLDAHEIALRLLTRREHGSGELAHKLQQRGVSREQAQEAIAELAEQGWQSDARFAEQFARDHAARGDGPLKIRAAMQSRGVHESAVTEAMRALDVDWAVCAGEVRRKRFGTDLPQDAAEQARQQRFLMTRGFAASDARMAVRSNDLNQD